MANLIKTISNISDNSKLGIISLFFVLAGAVYYQFGQIIMNLLPPCLLYTLTGLKCPMCGGQRAIYQLIHGNLLEALKFNALLILSIFAGLSIFLRMLYIRSFQIKPIWIYIYIVLVSVFTIIRNTINL